MKRYGGTLVYSSRDAEGILEVVDAQGVRSLHFGTSPRQSAMALDDPNRLELSYIRAMLSALLFVDTPQNILLFGLGGGSLARFMFHQFPQSKIDAVERRRSVVDVAHEYFSLPKDPRLTVHIAEATEHAQKAVSNLAHYYDLVLIDAYDHQGMDRTINAEEFFRNCAGLLQPRGVMSINLWGTHSVSLRHSIELINLCFPKHAYRLQVPNKGNIVGLGLSTDLVVRHPLDHLQPRALQLEIELGLEMRYFLKSLRLLKS